MRKEFSKNIVEYKHSKIKPKKNWQKHLNGLNKNYEFIEKKYPR